jgi:hypothetical protein
MFARGKAVNNYDFRHVRLLTSSIGFATEDADNCLPLRATSQIVVHLFQRQLCFQMAMEREMEQARAYRLKLVLLMHLAFSFLVQG